MVDLPGINYNCKPHIDDGSPLPQIGQRVALLTAAGDWNVECTVRDIDPPARRVLVDAVKMDRTGAQEHIAAVWLDWRDLEVAGS